MNWLRVTILIGAGAAVAMLVGKVPAALPELQAELGLSLVQSGWVIAIFNLVAAVTAVFLGTVSDQFGRLRVAISGMVLAALSGIAGGFVDSGTALLTPSGRFRYCTTADCSGAGAFTAVPPDLTSGDA